MAHIKHSRLLLMEPAAMYAVRSIFMERGDGSSRRQCQAGFIVVGTASGRWRRQQSAVHTSHVHKMHCAVCTLSEFTVQPYCTHTAKAQQSTHAAVAHLRSRRLHAGLRAHFTLERIESRAYRFLPCCCCLVRQSAFRSCNSTLQCTPVASQLCAVQCKHVCNAVGHRRRSQ